MINQESTKRSIGECSNDDEGIGMKCRMDFSIRHFFLPNSDVEVDVISHLGMHNMSALPDFMLKLFAWS